MYDDPYKNFAEIAVANRHYFTFGINNINHNNDIVKNDNVDQASKGYTFVSSVGITPYDVDKGFAETDGHYVTPIITTQNAVA